MPFYITLLWKDTKTLILKRKQFLTKSSLFVTAEKVFLLLIRIWVLKAWKWSQIFKNNQKLLNIWQQLWSPFMFEKIPHTIDNKIFPLKCGIDYGICFGISYGIGYSFSWKYRPIWVLVSVSDLNHNSGFSRTLGNSLEKDDLEIRVGISFYIFLIL